MKGRVSFSFENLVFGFLFLFVLITSGGQYPQTGIVYTFYVLVLGFCFACIILKSNTAIPKKPLATILVFLVFFILLLAINGEWLSNDTQNKVALKMMMIVPLIIALSSRAYRDNMQLFVAVFNLLLILSMAGLLLAYVQPDAYTVLPFSGRYSAVNNTYFYIEDITVREFHGIAFIKSSDLEKGYFRNQGIFYEAGAFSFFICLFYVIKNCYLKDKRWNALYIIAELTTLSAAGIVIFLYLFCYVHILHGRVVKNFRERLVLIVVLVCGLVGIFFANNIIDEILKIWGAAFGRDFTNESSALARWRDFYYGLMAAFESPLWGHGGSFDTYNAILLVETNSTKLLEWGGISNAIVAIFYRSGIFFLGLYLYLLWNFADRVTERGTWTFIVFIGFSVMLMHEPMEFSLLTMLFLCYPPSIPGEEKK